MTRTVLIGAVVALLAAVLALGGSTLGISTVWPALLAAAVVAAARTVSLGRVIAFVLGAVLSWVGAAVYAGTLPQTAASRATVAVVAVLALTAIAALSGNRLTLPAGLVGYGAFAAMYEPIYADTPTLFTTQSPVVLVTVLLSGALGIAAVELAELLTPAARTVVDADPELAEAADGGAL